MTPRKVRAGLAIVDLLLARMHPTDYGTQLTFQCRTAAADRRDRRLFRVVGFGAVGFQVSAKLGEMLVVPRFNRAEHIDG